MVMVAAVEFAPILSAQARPYGPCRIIGRLVYIHGVAFVCHGQLSLLHGRLVQGTDCEFISEPLTGRLASTDGDEWMLAMPRSAFLQKLLKAAKLAAQENGAGAEDLVLAVNAAIREEDIENGLG